MCSPFLLRGYIAFRYLVVLCVYIFINFIMLFIRMQYIRHESIIDAIKIEFKVKQNYYT